MSKEELLGKGGGRVINGSYCIEHMFNLKLTGYKLNWNSQQQKTLISDWCIEHQYIYLKFNFYRDIWSIICKLYTHLHHWHVNNVHLNVRIISCRIQTVSQTDFYFTKKVLTDILTSIALIHSINYLVGLRDFTTMGSPFLTQHAWSIFK